MFSTGRLPSSSLVPLRRTSWSQVQSDPHANHEYVGVRISRPAWIRSAHRVRKFSLNFIGPGALQLDVIGYLSFDRPCRSVLGPPAGWRRGPCVRFRQKIAFRHAANLGSARISHWSFRRVTHFVSRSRGTYKYTGCPTITSYDMDFFQYSLRIEWTLNNNKVRIGM